MTKKNYASKEEMRQAISELAQQAIEQASLEMAEGTYSPKDLNDLLKILLFFTLPPAETVRAAEVGTVQTTVVLERLGLTAGTQPVYVTPPPQYKTISAQP